jgi:mRNA-degrading endonuclease RelE of RelBE toxin-antitoxin system
MYSAVFDEAWRKYFEKLDYAVQDRVSKKIKQVLDFPHKRHLKKGAKFFVAEAGQNRILYMVFEESKEVRFFFVGNHKEYEKWYKQFF